MRRSGTHTTIYPTGEPVIDMLATAWAGAFEEAEEGDLIARAQIIDFFGRSRVSQLHQRGLIRWDPQRVPIQLSLIP